MLQKLRSLKGLLASIVVLMGAGGVTSLADAQSVSAQGDPSAEIEQESEAAGSKTDGSNGIDLEVQEDLDQPLPFEPLDPLSNENKQGEPVETEPAPPPSRTGSFRVGNRTPFPIRVVALLRGGGGVLNPERAHWDFAPGEGAQEGLLLSLGDAPLTLNSGDVVMAFALDGTGRYWGPFLAGATQYPGWDPDQETWLLPFPPEALDDLSAGHEVGRQGEIATVPVPPPSAESTIQLGSIRVGNRTSHPIRMTALLRTGDYAQDPQVVHWDFAPEEGGAEGLPLSAGDQLVMVQPGDVVVAFTTNDERQYWGPNVVGESLLPFWDPTAGVWSTILQP
ncbi:MAG: hypothetical protein HC924_16165 [Synechococcaceae cyanobacterium SM2_3_2]|nr:hypothetical protein [Synechococcaceae cyanobacterium SM2_3_2]